MSRERQISPDQVGFELNIDGTVRLTNQVKDWDYGKILNDFLSERAAWKDIPKEGQLLLVQVGEKANAYVLDRVFWTKEESIDLGKKKRGLYFAAGIVVFPYPLVEVSKEAYSDLFKKVIKYLPDEGALFVLEKLGADSDQKWRKKLIRDLDMTRVQFYKNQKKTLGYFVWTGRLPKEKQPVNLIENDGSHQYFRMRKLWKEMILSYKKMGCEVVNNEPLLSALSSSKFPPRDIDRLKQGYGVDVKSNCGCVWKVDLDGDWGEEPFKHCSDPDCDGIPMGEVKQGFKERKEIFVVGKKIALDVRCWDCSEGETHMEKIYKEILGNKKQRKITLLEETYCPHCGNSIDRRVKVDPEQIFRSN